MRRDLPWFLIAVLALGSCAKPGKIELAPQVNPIGPTGKPLIRPRGSADRGTPVVPGGNANPSAAAIADTPEEEIVYTSMDNPEGVIPELSDILGAAPKKRGPWEESETIAKQRAAREGKPILIWFTDSQSSPMCKALNQELLSTPEFSMWASEKVIRLRVDSNIGGSEFVSDPDISLDEEENRRAEVRAYVAALKKRYKVLGAPVLLLLNPGGEVIGRYRGYKRGQADFTWGLIKHGEAVSANARREWRSSLEKKGYREWQDRKGRKVFAKLTSYSNGTLTLIEPDGTRSKTHENKLCDDDQDWLDQQKKSRGL
jgi:hypothetical protein